MHTTIRDLFAREQVRQQMPVKPTQPGQDDDQQDQAMLSPDDIGQQEQQQQQQQAMGPQPEFPMHEVNSDPQRYPVDHAKALHSFLKNAAGGTGTFVTANKDSHEMAKTLARSGHLQHHGARLGGAGGGLRHVWSLTPKGMAAIGQQQQKPRSAMGGRPNPNQGGQVRRPGMFAYGTSEGVKKEWDTRGRGQTTRSYKAYTRSDRQAARNILMNRGFQSKGIKDYGIGRYAQSVHFFEHPDGHKAAISRSDAVGRDNFVNVHSSDDKFHHAIGLAMTKAKLGRTGD